jgi:hypothetical protein
VVPAVQRCLVQLMGSTAGADRVCISLALTKSTNDKED